MVATYNFGSVYIYKYSYVVGLMPLKKNGLSLSPITLLCVYHNFTLLTMVIKKYEWASACQNGMCALCKVTDKPQL